LGHIFAGTWNDGIFRSTDNGATWDSAGPEDTAIRSIAINCLGHIFAGTDGEGIFRSTDNGENWTQVNSGLINAWIRCLASNSLGDIFAGTGTTESSAARITDKTGQIWG
jgi:ligand-binding sensor domain-containing protein